MTAVTEKPHCLVCSTDSLCRPSGYRLRFHICSQKCQLELWKCMGIYDKSMEVPSRKYSRRMGLTGHEMLIADLMKEKNTEKK